MAKNPRPLSILIIGSSESGKRNALLNPINQELDIDKTYLYAKDPYEAKYQLPIDKRKRTGLKVIDFNGFQVPYQFHSSLFQKSVFL